ncbi:MAG TPA: hypothetical protein VHU23_08585 [Rhizomicrobium sp.]|jgi:hypothetical protein|nr:hypothetical protein [Rhizomicrobium sp.]
MTTVDFEGSTQEEAERKEQEWRTANPKILPKGRRIMDSGSPPFPYAPKAHRENRRFVISIDFDG